MLSSGSTFGADGVDRRPASGPVYRDSHVGRAVRFLRNSCVGSRDRLLSDGKIRSEPRSQRAARTSLQNMLRSRSRPAWVPKVLMLARLRSSSSADMVWSSSVRLSRPSSPRVLRRRCRSIVWGVPSVPVGKGSENDQVKGLRILSRPSTSRPSCMSSDHRVSQSAIKAAATIIES